MELSYRDTLQADILPSYKDSLSHHGIKGMKWGIRRYQNEDGTLTSAGKKRYQNTQTMYKDLKKQVRAKRGEQHGKANKFMTLTPIGEHSKAYIDDTNAKRSAYENSEAYKKWAKDYNKFQQKWDKKFRNSQSYDDDKLQKQWEKESEEMVAKRPNKNFKDPYDAYATYTPYGRKYAQSYLNGAGKDLSIAYIRDLGYSETTASKMVNQLIKSGRTLGMD